jgi:P-type Ca2+ transporter type 2C
MTERMDAHALPTERALKEMETHLQNGLSSEEARARIERYGYNELQERPRPGFLRLLLDQFNNFLIIILIVAAVVSLLLGETVDALAILAIVALNSALGVIQESKAEQALAALKKMAAPNARVIRDGQQTTIPARELVPGDIVLVEAGNYVPADLRLVESVNLKAEEASLTGESVPVNKDARVVLDADIPLGDRKNSAFMSTLVSYGRGTGLVIATGMATQIGLIAEMLQSSADEETPLQKKLAELGKTLGIVSLAVCGLIFLYGLLRDTELAMIFESGVRAYLSTYQETIVDLFMTAVSLAIAAVPEGLPAVVTICLALGMQRMVSRHVLIRKLPAVETLGCATVICSDKTGTLTQNEMTVVRGWAGGRDFRVSGEGYLPEGQFYRDEARQGSGGAFAPSGDAATALMLHGALLCNDARLQPSGEEGGESTWRMVGDPTEGALVVAAAKAGLWRADVEKELPRLAEIPFDSERKRMTTIHRVGDLGLRSADFGDRRAAAPGQAPQPYLAFVKGAPDFVLDYCDDIALGGDIEPLTPELRQTILDANTAMGQQALRVLGIACRPLDTVPEEPNAEVVERNLTFLGLLGMIDPARPEARAAVSLARTAGLKSIMITGDYRDTAQAIAAQIGMLNEGGAVVTGAEIDAMSDDELTEMVDRLDACARSSPQTKMRIVDALRRRGHVVAMTGDGVNDAPALKRADIGVAMGITGTDVTKETADMVLTDDNFASIVSAIEEGRIIYSNIRKFVFYLISCNVGEILIIFVSMLAGLPIPLQPIMLLWLNLVTDGAPALALGMERGDPDIMKRPPRPTREPVINRGMLPGIIVIPIADTIAVLSSFLLALNRFGSDNLAAAQTVAFATLVTSELLRAYTARSERYSVFKAGIFGNKWMQYATGLSFVLLLLAIYVPFLQDVFGTVPLTINDWAVMLPFILMAPIAAELTKMVIRWRASKVV